ncbi:hypothetical protein L6164_000018 [Bauhinia variegata]|nr:hypothetical protein L6164_000018 [Bauhinia variegata]
MTETHNEEAQVMVSHNKRKRRRRCLIVIGVLLLLLLLLFIVGLILAKTVFKPREPRTKLVSASLEGIAPRVSLPAIQIQLNVTLDLKILVENRNHASFKHQQGKSLLLYKGKQVGDTEIFPGVIPAMGSAMLPCRLTLQLDEIASNLTTFVGDVMGGKLTMETVTTIPGKVSFLGIIKKHVVAVSNCQFNFSVFQMKILNQTCKNKTKF